MSDLLPKFRYHPNPLATKSIVASDVRCAVCDRLRGFVYVGPALMPAEDVGAFCPWCIADGSAAMRFEIEFVDVSYESPGDVENSDLVDELTHRTPGFYGWQQERWLFHCGDGSAFRGIFGSYGLRKFPEAIQQIRAECQEGGWNEGDIDDYLSSLRVDQSPSAYLFRCLRCQEYLAYSDFI